MGGPDTEDQVVDELVVKVEEGGDDAVDDGKEKDEYGDEGLEINI